MANYFRYDSWTKSSMGPAVPGAQVFVLSQPANLPPMLTTSIPPSPQLTVYADVNGLVPLQQPIITDGLGHVSFYLLNEQAFTLAVYLGGRLQNFYPDQFPMGANGAPGLSGLTSDDGSIAISTGASENSDIIVANVRNVNPF